MRVDRKFVFTGIAAVGLVTLLGVFQQSNWGQAGIQGIDDQSTGRVLSQPDPCEHQNGMVRSSSSSPETGPVSILATKAQTIARVEIVEIGEPQFGTSDGHVPDPLPTNATEEEEETYPDDIFSLIVLDATDVYSGTADTGYVIIRMGGVTAECPDYAHVVEPAFAEDVGDEGIIELRSIPEFLLEDPPPIYQHLLDKAEELNEDEKVHYEPMLVWTWYRYVGSSAESRNLVTPMPVTQLESEIQTAVP